MGEEEGVDVAVVRSPAEGHVTLVRRNRDFSWITEWPTHLSMQKSVCSSLA